MKNYILTLFILLFSLSIYAQCVPDQQFTSPGIYPDQATNLPSANVGQPYSAIITALTPLDTVVDISGLLLNVTIANIDLTSITGLPNNFTYDCQPSNCSFPGGAYSCAEISSTIDPTISDIGVYPLIMTTSTLAINVPLLGTYTQVDTVDYFFIEITSATSNDIGYFNDNSFEIKNIYPNPIKNNSKLYFITGNSKKINLVIYNTLGNIVSDQFLTSNRGVNDINLNLSHLSDGIYTIVLKSDNKSISSKIIVSK